MWGCKGLLGGATGKEPACQCRRQEMCVQSLGGEDPLEEGRIHAWTIPWTEEPRGLQSIWSQGIRQDWSNLAHTHAWRNKDKWNMVFALKGLTLGFRNRYKKRWCLFKDRGLILHHAIFHALKACIHQKTVLKQGNWGLVGLFQPPEWLWPSSSNLSYG